MHTLTHTDTHTHTRIAECPQALVHITCFSQTCTYHTWCMNTYICMYVCMYIGVFSRDFGTYRMIVMHTYICMCRSWSMHTYICMYVCT